MSKVSFGGPNQAIPLQLEALLATGSLGSNNEFLITIDNASFPNVVDAGGGTDTLDLQSIVTVVGQQQPVFHYVGDGLANDGYEGLATMNLNGFEKFNLAGAANISAGPEDNVLDGGSANDFFSGGGGPTSSAAAAATTRSTATTATTCCSEGWQRHPRCGLGQRHPEWRPRDRHLARQHGRRSAPDPRRDRGRVAVTLACPRRHVGRCAGKLDVGGKAVSYSIRPGSSAAVTLERRARGGLLRSVEHGRFGLMTVTRIL